VSNAKILQFASRSPDLRAALSGIIRFEHCPLEQTCHDTDFKLIGMSHPLHTHVSRIIRILWLLMVMASLSGLSRGAAALEVEDTIQAFGETYKVITEVPGRPWIEKQHVYEDARWVITCSFVGSRCLWVEYYYKETDLTDEQVIEEVRRLMPDEEWKPQHHGMRIRWWFNEKGDRITRRSTGFSLHTNAYIENVLSRREEWQF